MRRLLALLALLLVCGPLARADEVATPDEVSIENVVWYYKPEQSFKRILEYFDGEERQGRKTIIRTQEGGRRAGLYFVVRLSDYADELPAGCAFVVDMIRADQKKPVSETFTLPAEAKPHREFWLGFTGDDVPPDEEAPVAWRVRFLDPEGKTVTTYDSFLWSKPPAPAAEAEPAS